MEALGALRRQGWVGRAWGTGSVRRQGWVGRAWGTGSGPGEEELELELELPFQQLGPGCQGPRETLDVAALGFRLWI